MDKRVIEEMARAIRNAEATLADGCISRCWDRDDPIPDNKCECYYAALIRSGAVWPIVRAAALREAAALFGNDSPWAGDAILALLKEAETTEGK